MWPGKLSYCHSCVEEGQLGGTDLSRHFVAAGLSRQTACQGFHGKMWKGTGWTLVLLAPSCPSAQHNSIYRHCCFGSRTWKRDAMLPLLKRFHSLWGCSPSQAVHGWNFSELHSHSASTAGFLSSSPGDPLYQVRSKRGNHLSRLQL